MTAEERTELLEQAVAELMAKAMEKAGPMVEGKDPELRMIMAKLLLKKAALILGFGEGVRA